MNLGDLTITSLDTITAFDVVTGNYKFTLDELETASITQSEEKTDITGRGGRKLTSLKKNKSVTISGENGLLSGGLLESQTGGRFRNEATLVQWCEVLTINGYTATTGYTAVGTVGKEIDSVYMKRPNGTILKELTQAESVTHRGSEFTYDPETRELCFDDGEIRTGSIGGYEIDEDGNITHEWSIEDNEDYIANGTEILVFYKRQILADVIDNSSNYYSGKVTLYIDAIAEDKCSNIYRVQILIPKADLNGEFEFGFGDDQSVHSFEAEALAGACGRGGELWTYTVFGINDPDVKNGIIHDEDGEIRFYDEGVPVAKGLVSDGTDMYYFTSI